jgi:hypothetical protein
MNIQSTQHAVAELGKERGIMGYWCAKTTMTHHRYSVALRADVTYSVATVMEVVEAEDGITKYEDMEDQLIKISLVIILLH